MTLGGHRVRVGQNQAEFLSDALLVWGGVVVEIVPLCLNFVKFPRKTCIIYVKYNHGTKAVAGECWF